MVLNSPVPVLEISSPLHVDQSITGQLEYANHAETRGNIIAQFRVSDPSKPSKTKELCCCRDPYIYREIYSEGELGWDSV